jgi:hypothetical protein
MIPFRLDVNKLTLLQIEMLLDKEALLEKGNKVPENRRQLLLERLNALRELGRHGGTGRNSGRRGRTWSANRGSVAPIRE